MKIKYANKIYDVLYTMKVLGKLIYAVEDEPNHIDWLVNVEVIDEQKSMKVYRVENEAEQKGLWRKFDGTYEPLFDMLTDGQCRDLPMDDNPIYREGGKRWFASAPSKETLQKWFSKRDLEELLLMKILEVNHPHGLFKVNSTETMRTEELVSWLESINYKI